VAVKRNTRWPREIIEIPAKRPDPRSEDAQMTQRIDKSELEDVLRRTKSGFRRAVRESDPEVAKTTEPPLSLEAPSLEASPLEMPHLSPIPEPVITVKPDSTPPPPSSTEIAEAGPPFAVGAAPAPSRWVVALVVAALTFAALAIGYALGHGAGH
jgi:hypothetical protein